MDRIDRLAAEIRQLTEKERAIRDRRREFEAELAGLVARKAGETLERPGLDVYGHGLAWRVRVQVSERRKVDPDELVERAEAAGVDWGELPVRTKVEMDRRAYRKAPPAIRAIVDGASTISAASPRITIEEL